MASLMYTVDHGKKWCHFLFKSISGSKANNWGKFFILFVTVLLIGEEWLSVLNLSETGRKRQFSSKILLQIVKIFFHNAILMGTVLKIWTSIALVSIEYFSLIPFCWYLIAKCSAFQLFFVKTRFLISVKFLNSNRYGIKTNVAQPWF